LIAKVSVLPLNLESITINKIIVMDSKLSGKTETLAIKTIITAIKSEFIKFRD
jgi:hypothetical protein